MTHPLAFCAALCAALLFTPRARAQDLYVGSNSSGVTTDFTSGTNAYDNTYIGFDPGANANTLNVLNTNTLLTNSVNLNVGNEGSSNSLVISNGGVVANSFGYIGFTTNSSNNSALVTGAGSVWTNSGDLQVGGDGSSNSMVISNGGVVANTDGTIGFNFSNNSVLVTGANSLWNNSTNLYVGYLGSGNSLSVAAGATVSNASSGYIGYSNSAANNTVLVTDNSQWLNGAILFVGREGAGNSLQISNSSTVSNNYSGLVGFTASSSNNTVLVTDNSQWLNGDLYVGTDGSSNSLVISNSSTVANANGYIGSSSSSSNNSVLVTGAGSLWTNSGQLAVGYEGNNNSMEIADGAKVVSFVEAAIGFSGGAENSVLVTGSNSLWIHDGDFFVGNAGDSNSLTISSGGKFDTGSAAIGFFGGAENSVLVAGSGSLWTNSTDLYVGYDGNGNSMVISNGATVASGTGTIGDQTTSSNNSVLVTGAGSLWTNNSNLTVGNYGSGSSLVISNGGTVAAGDSLIFSSNNSALVTGAGSTWTNSGVFQLGGDGGNNLTVADGGTVAASSIIIASGASSSATLNIGRFGQSDTGGTIVAPTIAFGDGTGAINFNQNNKVVITSAISGAGTINQLGGGTSILTGTNTYSGATTIAAGKLFINGDQSGATGDVLVAAGATLGGSGIIGGDTFIAGTHNAGNSPGLQTFLGDLTYSNASVFLWELAQNTAGQRGIAFDGVDVGGQLTVETGASSTLVFNADGSAVDWSDAFWGGNQTWLVFSNSTNPTLGSSDVFAINSDWLDSQSAGLSTQRPGSSFAWDTVDNNIYLNYTVPEPSTYALLAVAAAGCGAHLLRRRKRGKIS